MRIESEAPRWRLHYFYTPTAGGEVDRSRPTQVGRLALSTFPQAGRRADSSGFSFFITELVHQACYPTRDAARHDLFAYIEVYYNRKRLHSALGYITPEQAERQVA
jgi:transposase InsO family protein